jgi:hypothetical protein
MLYRCIASPRFTSSIIILEYNALYGKIPDHREQQTRIMNIWRKCMRSICIGALICAVCTSLLFGFNIGTKKDLRTGLSTKNNGLGYDEVYVTANGKKLTSNKAALGSKLIMQFTGVDGFKEVKGKVYPGLSMYIGDKSGKKIAEFDDLFNEYTAKGMSVDMASSLQATLNTGAPMKKNTDYIWKVRIWDKKGKGEIVSEMILKME